MQLFIVFEAKQIAFCLLFPNAEPGHRPFSRTFSVPNTISIFTTICFRTFLFFSEAAKIHLQRLFFYLWHVHCAGVDGKNYGVDESIFNLNRLQFVHLAPDKLYSCSLVPNFDTLHCLVMAKMSGNNVK